MFKQLKTQSDVQENIVTEILRYTGKEELIEKRVAAVKCLASSILPYMGMLDNSCLLAGANMG